MSRNLTAHLAADLRTRIVDGIIQPGDTLPIKQPLKCPVVKGLAHDPPFLRSAVHRQYHPSEHAPAMANGHGLTAASVQTL
ncbi:MAG TPA: hypothetical protein VLA19_27195, partial [Herpetosiphonaceae bacterium]|nr:hypothetical protein [Herpetosiphonaceae bacterium]